MSSSPAGPFSLSFQALFLSYKIRKEVSGTALCSWTTHSPPPWGTSLGVNRWMQVDLAQDSALPTAPQLSSPGMWGAAKMPGASRAMGIIQWRTLAPLRQLIAQCGWQRSAEQEEKDNSCACCHGNHSVCQLGGACWAAQQLNPALILPFQFAPLQAVACLGSTEAHPGDSKDPVIQEGLSRVAAVRGLEELRFPEYTENS